MMERSMKKETLSNALSLVLIKSVKFVSFLKNFIIIIIRLSLLNYFLFTPNCYLISKILKSKIIWLLKKNLEQFGAAFLTILNIFAASGFITVVRFHNEIFFALIILMKLYVFNIIYFILGGYIQYEKYHVIY